MDPAKKPPSPTPGYEVEFIPIERRLASRRLSDRNAPAATTAPTRKPDQRKRDRRKP
jgi:hypothetical protein